MFRNGMKKWIITASVIALPTPYLLYYSSNYLFFKEKENNLNEMIQSSNLRHLMEEFKKKEENDFTIIDSNKIFIDLRQTKCFFTKVCENNTIDNNTTIIDNNCQFYTNYLKGILFLYIPIKTQKGNLFIRNCYLLDTNKKKFYFYKSENIPIQINTINNNQLMNNNQLNNNYGIRYILNEEDDLNVHSFTMNEIEKLFKLNENESELKCAKVSLLAGDHFEKKKKPLECKSYLVEFSSPVKKEVIDL
ncbi:hypothetical protein ABK040_002203 [Willaertia magna]